MLIVVFATSGLIVITLLSGIETRGKKVKIYYINYIDLAYECKRKGLTLKDLQDCGVPIYHQANRPWIGSLIPLRWDNLCQIADILNTDPDDLANIFESKFNTPL